VCGALCWCVVRCVGVWCVVLVCGALCWCVVRCVGVWCVVLVRVESICLDS